MPGTDAGHLSQPLVGLSGKLLRVPATYPTFEAMTFGDSNDINHLILVKHCGYGHGFLQVLLGPVHFICDSASIQLHLHDVILLHQIQILLQLFLSGLILPLLAVLGESLLLALLFIKSASALVTEVLGKDGFQSTQAPDRMNITHNPHNNDWRGLNNGNGLNFFSAVHLPQSVGHASFISQEGSEVEGVAGIVFGPRADPAPVLLAAPAGQEPHVARGRTTGASLS
uniref:Uncharacterized protein n=1 Tax=Poecilia mexicana TaxID=48701 RepID=A0A3B3XPH9_9TELE